MSDVSSAYKLATHIHDTFIGANDAITSAELSESKVRSRVGSTSSKASQRIEVTGLMGEHSGHQTLAKDARGTYHLSTTFHKEGSKHVQIDITPGSTFDELEILADTMFMHKLVEIAHRREKA